jgi:hypothetical protein
MGAGETARYLAPRTADGHSDTASATAHAFDVAEAGRAECFTAEAMEGVRLAVTSGLKRFFPRRLGR